MDVTALNKAKIKSLEKSLISKDKTIKDGKEKLDNAHDTIAKLEKEIYSCINSKTKPVKKELDVGGENLTNAKKDVNENLEPESGSKKEISPVRSWLPSRSPPGTPSSPHTPQGPPPSSFSSQLQPSATLSCYFEKSGPDLVHKRDLTTEDYIKNLSKLNLAPRIKRQEDV